MCVSVWFFCVRMCFAHSRTIFIHAPLPSAPSVSFSQSLGHAKRNAQEKGIFLFFWEFCPSKCAARFHVFGFLLKLLTCLPGRIPGSRAVQLQGETEPHRLLQHILFRMPVSQEALILSTHGEMHIESLCHTLLLGSPRFSLWHASHFSVFCPLH